MPKADEQHLRFFELLWLAFYRPSASLKELAEAMEVSAPTVKKMLSHLRTRRVLSGRAGNLTTNLQHLRRGLPLGSSSAFVYIRLNIPALQELSAKRGRKSPGPYADEEGLLDYVKNVLPRDATDVGKVIVERFFIQMGDPSAACVLLVHGAHEKHIQDFIRKRVEPCPGVTETRTLGVTDMG